jgi:ribonuclease BN (tRNA processing enzyme)
VEDSVTLAMRAGVKKLILFHHDPSHDDKTIDAYVRQARAQVKKQRSKLKIEAAREGMSIHLNGRNGR